MQTGSPFSFVDITKRPYSTARPSFDAAVLSTPSAIHVQYTVVEAILSLVEHRETIYVTISFSASELTITSSDGVVKTSFGGTLTVSVL